LFLFLLIWLLSIYQKFNKVYQDTVVVLAGSERPGCRAQGRVQVHGVAADQLTLGAEAECPRLFNPFEVVNVLKNANRTFYFE
jgi:hypothetical protein